MGAGAGGVLDRAFGTEMAGRLVSGAAAFRFGETGFTAGLMAVDGCGFGSAAGRKPGLLAAGVAGAAPCGVMSAGRTTGRATPGRG